MTKFSPGMRPRVVDMSLLCGGAREPRELPRHTRCGVDLFSEGLKPNAPSVTTKQINAAAQEASAVMGATETHVLADMDPVAAAPNWGLCLMVAGAVFLTALALVYKVMGTAL